MCVILVGRINRQQHEMAKRQNPDGFSLFTLKQGLVKAPNAKQVKLALGDFAIWHYRIGTSGKVNPADVTNIHPFEVCGGKYYLYHNGILGAGVGELSDTNALAKTLYELDVDTVRSTLRALTANQRFVLVDASDPKKYELFGNWACESGVIMSHKLYQPVYKYHGALNKDE